MARGGARTPNNPAPVSGPGALSRRTDGQAVRSPGGMPYGDNADFVDLQSSAPMAKAATATPNTRPGSAAANGAPLPTPFGAPTERPDEPITEGNPLGPGAGPEVLAAQPLKEQSRQEIVTLRQKYLPSLELMANSADAPPSFVRFVRYLRDQ